MPYVNRKYMYASIQPTNQPINKTKRNKTNKIPKNHKCKIKNGKKTENKYKKYKNNKYLVSLMGLDIEFKVVAEPAELLAYFRGRSLK